MRPAGSAPGGRSYSKPLCRVPNGKHATITAALLARWQHHHLPSQKRHAKSGPTVRKVKCAKVQFWNGTLTKNYFCDQPASPVEQDYDARKIVASKRRVKRTVKKVGNRRRKVEWELGR